MHLLCLTTHKSTAATLVQRLRHDAGRHVHLSKQGDTWRIHAGNHPTPADPAARITRWASEPETLTDAQWQVAARYTRLFLSGKGRVRD